MKAIRIDRNGGPEVLELADVPKPAPGPGEALVHQTACGVNYIDVYVRTGLYKANLPVIDGREGAGVVEAVGEGVTDVKPGDRVAYAMTPKMGGYAEYNAVPAKELVPIPDGVSDDDACAIMLQGMTAHYLVNDTFPLQSGQTALVHAAAGGVGSTLVQLAKAKGATVIATVGTEDKAALARGYGADHVILYSQEDFAEATRRIVGDRGIDVAYDSVGKDTWERSLSLLRPRGMLVIYGNSSGPTPPVDPARLMTGGSIYLTRPTLGNYISTRDELLARARDLFGAIADGTLRVRIGGTYPLARAADAHRDLEARKTTGKLLLKP
ncbi:MAG: quinone oxidoreductase, partial [Candidatus Eremiobacteraeota bacterium]|nr:quinone oxidoreductase [Candidatus Eremiobacteraeota bacterium]